MRFVASLFPGGWSVIVWVGAERDVQDCDHKGRLSIAILNDGDDSLVRSAAGPFAFK